MPPSAANPAPLAAPRGRPPRRHGPLASAGTRRIPPAGPLGFVVSVVAHVVAIAAFAAWAAPGQEAAGVGGVMAVTLVGAGGLREVEPTPPAPVAAQTAAASPPVPAAHVPDRPEPLPDAPALPDAQSAPEGALPLPPPPVPPQAEPTAAALIDVPPPPPRPAASDRPSTARKPAPAAAGDGRPALQARGDGGSGDAGVGATAVTAGPTGEAAAAEAVWAAQIQRRLQSGIDPPAGAAGSRLTLAISVAPDGRLVGVAIRRSSGDPAVDAAALRAVRRLGRLPPAPHGLARPRYEFTAPIAWN